jgi:RimJ/RimL family protein N-acetyltransferase
VYRQNGTVLTLREFTAADDAALISWLRSPEELTYFTGPVLSWPLDTAQLDEVRADPQGRAWSALDESGALVGHIELVTTGPGVARIVRVLVDPAQRGRGLGEQLVAAVIDRASADGIGRLTLNVVATNAGAIRLYEKLGFEHVGPHPDGPAALVMERAL